jgi:hypothetical protein
MARWRAEAIKRLPELRQVIASAESVMTLWHELQDAFEQAYLAQPPAESLIAGIYSFADWCLEAPRVDDAGHDPFSALIVAFYEDIPKFRPARDDMPRWFLYSEVAQNRRVFSYMIGDKEYDELVAYMAKNQHRYRPRPRTVGL